MRSMPRQTSIGPFLALGGCSCLGLDQLNCMRMNSVLYHSGGIPPPPCHPPGLSRVLIRFSFNSILADLSGLFMISSSDFSLVVELFIFLYLKHIITPFFIVTVVVVVTSSACIQSLYLVGHHSNAVFFTSIHDLASEWRACLLMEISLSDYLFLGINH